MGRTLGERRVGERLVIGARPAVQLRHTRNGLLGRRAETVDGSLVQVSVTGALVATPRPLRDVVVGSAIEIEMRGRRTKAVVRRLVTRHDMSLYGLEYVRVDDWFQALIDRAILEARGDMRTAWSQSR